MNADFSVDLALLEELIDRDDDDRHHSTIKSVGTRASNKSGNDMGRGTDESAFWTNTQDTTLDGRHSNKLIKSQGDLLPCSMSKPQERDLTKTVGLRL